MLTVTLATDASRTEGSASPAATEAATNAFGDSACTGAFFDAEVEPSATPSLPRTGANIVNTTTVSMVRIRISDLTRLAG